MNEKPYKILFILFILCATKRLITNGGRIHVKSIDPIHSVPSLEWKLETVKLSVDRETAGRKPKG